jgi:uncharacterized alkaline shock family protein YloU
VDREENRLGEVPPTNEEDPDRPLVADEVVATYVADAVRPVAGVVELHGSTWQALSERVHMDVPSKGVLVRHEQPGVISIDVHVKVAWGTVIPVLAQTVQDAVTKKVESLLDLTVGSVTLYVDEVEPPPDPTNG